MTRSQPQQRSQSQRMKWMHCNVDPLPTFLPVSSSVRLYAQINTQRWMKFILKGVNCEAAKVDETHSQKAGFQSRKGYFFNLVVQPSSGWNSAGCFLLTFHPYIQPHICYHEKVLNKTRNRRKLSSTLTDWKFSPSAELQPPTGLN